MTGTTEAVRGGKTLQQAETSFILSTFFTVVVAVGGFYVLSLFAA